VRRVMFVLALIAGLVGAALSLRFRVFSLVPALSLLLPLVALAAVSTGESILSTLATMLLVAISAQLGYFAGSALQSVVGHWRLGKTGPAASALSLPGGPRSSDGGKDAEA
jgi:hypothetical protein